MGIAGSLFIVYLFVVIFMFIIWVAVTRWLFRVNDIHKELVKIRCALESMDNYIVGVRGRGPKEGKEEITPKVLGRTCSKCGKALYYPGELEKRICESCQTKSP